MKLCIRYVETSGTGHVVVVTITGNSLARLRIQFSTKTNKKSEWVVNKLSISEKVSPREACTQNELKREREWNIVR